MHKVIVYVDDAAHARRALAPLLAGTHAGATHWVLVACAPRMTHRISKWVSHSARENWRTKWADRLFAQLQPWLAGADRHVSTVLARGPLPDLLAQLQAEHGAHTPVLDLRRPRQEAEAPQPPAAQTAPVVTRKPARRWSVPGSLTGLGLMFMFTAD